MHKRDMISTIHVKVRGRNIPRKMTWSEDKGIMLVTPVPGSFL